MAIEMTIPLVKWNKRAIPEGETDYEWVEESSQDLFEGKRVVLFSLPGAFTPTCSSTHLPGYEARYDELLEQDVDEVYCLSVNDSFVMNAWFADQGIVNVKPIADGNGEFTRHMGMLVEKSAVCFGLRSQRYSAVIDNGRVEMIFCEQRKEDNFAGDPFEVSYVDTMFSYLETARDVRREEIKRYEEAQAEFEEAQAKLEETEAEADSNEDE